MTPKQKTKKKTSFDPEYFQNGSRERAQTFTVHADPRVGQFTPKQGLDQNLFQGLIRQKPRENVPRPQK